MKRKTSIYRQRLFWAPLGVGGLVLFLWPRDDRSSPNPVDAEIGVSETERPTGLPGPADEAAQEGILTSRLGDHSPPPSPAPEIAAKQVATRSALWLRGDLTALLGSLQQELPERRHEALSEWRQRNASMIAMIETELAGEIEFPETLAELSSFEVLPVPSEIAAMRRRSPEATAFLTERHLLSNERRAITANPDLPKPERMRQLDEWERVNEERLRNHRFHALSLGYLNVELFESERQARSMTPNP